MTTLYRIILSAIIAAIAAATIQSVSDQNANTLVNPIHFVIILIATVLAAFISPTIKPSVSTPSNKSVGKSASRKGREIGTVKWFNVSKGYGFVTRASGEEIFVHFRSISGNGRKVLREGQQIEFSVVDGDKGPQAEDVDIVVEK
jgi:CspA family cold shock protein